MISLDRFRILLLRQRAALCFRVFCQALEAPADVVAAEAVIIEASGVLPDGFKSLLLKEESFLQTPHSNSWWNWSPEPASVSEERGRIVVS